MNPMDMFKMMAGGGQTSSSNQTVPAPLPPEPPPQQQPGKKPGRPQSALPTFIGSAAVPGSANTGGKTMLGSA